MDALLLSKNGPVSRAQIYPFHLYRDELRETRGFDFEEWSLNSPSEINLAKLRRFDVVFIQAKFFGQDLSALRGLLRVIEGKKVILDDWDCAGRCFFDVTPHMDLYVKKQVLRDFEKYRYRYRDGKNFIDSLEEEGPLQEVEVPAGFRAKLLAGWNLGTAERLYRNQLSCVEGAGGQGGERPIDVSMRLSLSRLARPHRHRLRALDALASLGDEFQVVSSTVKIEYASYYRELCQSKMTLSPWGGGEVCYRDFEAVTAGALLIKPPMEHLTTYPDIYRAGETYVPVRPDFSDLRDVCRYYLHHEAERLRITRAALQKYQAYFRDRMFLTKLDEILARVGLGTEPVRAQSTG
jgi:hypothetical protein